MKKRRKRDSKVEVNSQESALAKLRSSSKLGFGVFSSNSDDDTSSPPDRIYILLRMPTLKFLPRLTLKTAEMSKNLIEDLIAHRRNVWPDAEPIDPDVRFDEEMN